MKYERRRRKKKIKEIFSDKIRISDVTTRYERWLIVSFAYVMRKSKQE